MKKNILIVCLLVCCSFVFSASIGFELFADCDVGFEFGHGEYKIEESKVISVPVNASVGFGCYLGKVGFGLSLGGGVSILGINYNLLGISAGYTATPFRFNLDYFLEYKINEKNRISFSPVYMSVNYVKKGTDLNSEEEIEVNRQVNFFRFVLKYTRLSEPVNKVQKGFFVGLGYTWLCGTGEKDGDFLKFENNHPIMLTIGGKVLFNAF